MDLTEVRKRVLKITTIRDDPETFHILKDELYLDLLRKSATGVTIKACALEALKLEALNVPVWYA